MDPADYERQMTATAASVRAVGSFIAELADRQAPVACFICNRQHLAMSQPRAHRCCRPVNQVAQSTSQAQPIISAPFAPSSRQTMHCRLPRTVGAHVSLLVPHLGCKAYPIRSGIVNAIGHMIARGFEAPEEDTNAPGG